MSSSSSHLPLLKLTGSDPLAWGQQHGEMFAAQIRELAAIRAELLAASLPEWSQASVDRLCDDQLAALKLRWPRVLAELQGIASTSGVTLRQLVILNAYTDLKDFVDGQSPAVEGGCSALAIKAKNANLTAQTWDMHKSAQPFTLVLEIPGEIQPMRVLTVMGCLGLAGVNASGVSVMINNLNCNETNRAGLIWPGFVRLLLGEPTACAASARLAGNLPSSGHNYLIADRDEALNIETTGRRKELTGSISRSNPGTMVHTNHYLGSLASAEIAPRLGPTTQARLAAMEIFFGGNPVDHLTPAAVVHALFECGPLCDSICLPGTSDRHSGATCGGIVVDHAAGAAFAFRGRYDPAQAVEWRFAD